MARDRNYKVLITSLAIFIFGVLALYDSIVRPVAQTPAGIVLDFIIIGISFYGFYLFLSRSRDIFRHPDVKKFLSFENPGQYIDLFEREFADGSPKKFRDGFVTRNFIVSGTFYRFRWAYAKEITMAYVEQSRVSFHRIPLPFIGATTVIIHLNNGTTMHINCDSKSEAESLLKLLTAMAPSARFGSAIYGKPGKLSDYDAIARDAEETISQISGQMQAASPKNEPPAVSKANVPEVKSTAPEKEWKTNTVAENKTKASPPVTPVKAPIAGPAHIRQFSKDELFSMQIKNLYDSMEKEDIEQSLYIIDSMGETMNLAATDILEILLEYVDEHVRKHAAFALGQLSQKSSVEPLIRALDDPSVQVRENAAVALGKIGDQRAVAPLQQVSTEDVRTKKAAVSALARIDQKLGIFNRPDGQTSFFYTASEKNH